MSEGFILCIAKNGLTDFFSQIWLCTLYAKSIDRSIILMKTHYEGTSLFDLFDFSTYPVPIYELSKISAVIHTDVIPSECKQLLVYEGESIVSVKAGPNFPIDKTKTYEAGVLIVHCDSGIMIDRVTPTVEFLKNIRFTPKFIDFLSHGLSKLPGKYNSIQIRHTDYRTNIIKILELLDGFINSTTEDLYVATDNSELVNSLKEKYGDRILYNDTVYDRKGEAILQTQSDRGILENAFLDLFILARTSNDIMYFYTQSRSLAYGYTKLAARLKSHIDLIEWLLTSVQDVI